jgi:hypothetical protein
MVWVSKKEIDFINWVSPPGIMIKKNIFFFYIAPYQVQLNVSVC